MNWPPSRLLDLRIAYDNGMNAEEIAEIMGTTANAVIKAGRAHNIPVRQAKRRKPK